MVKWLLILWMSVFAVTTAMLPGLALAQDTDGDGDDDGPDDGEAGDDAPYQGGGDVSQLEVYCTTEATPYYCVPYHQLYCQQGFALACNLFQLGQNCYGGDANSCNYYISIIQANRDCQVNGNGAACSWLQQQGL